jgi:hypothetical protein
MGHNESHIDKSLMLLYKIKACLLSLNELKNIYGYIEKEGNELYCLRNKVYDIDLKEYTLSEIIYLKENYSLTLFKNGNNYVLQINNNNENDILEISKVLPLVEELRLNISNHTEIDKNIKEIRGYVNNQNKILYRIEKKREEKIEKIDYYEYSKPILTRFNEKNIKIDISIMGSKNNYILLIIVEIEFKPFKNFIYDLTKC